MIIVIIITIIIHQSSAVPCVCVCAYVNRTLELEKSYVFEQKYN